MVATATKRKAAERQRRKEAGLARLELWAPREHHATIKAFAAELARKRS